MERISLQSDRNAIIAEHVHRYRISSLLAKGKVLDISCGIGYGSKILTEGKQVESYQGVDISPKDIDYANINFKATNIEFCLGDITSLSFADNTFDSIVTLETLEHLSQPEIAIKELSRVLKPEGILIGSVPEDTYDRKCEQAYGPNPYHLQHFSEATLRNLLKQGFKNIEILKVGVVFGTLVSSSAIHSTKEENYTIEGSLFFIASKDPKPLNLLVEKIQGKFIPAFSMLDYDLELELPLRKTIVNQEALVQSKDKLIKEQDLFIKDRDKCIADMEKMIREKDIVITDMEKMIREKDIFISKAELMIRERDESILSMEKIIDKRWEIIQEYEDTLKSLKGDES